MNQVAKIDDILKYRENRPFISIGDGNFDILSNFLGGNELGMGNIY